MQKTIKINSNLNLKLDNNVRWALIYRNQFEHDILPDILPIVSAGIDIAVETLGENKVENLQDLAKALDADTINDALFTLSGLEFTTFINIAWSMAKCADEDIPEPMEWAKQFTSFPMDIIAPEIVRLLVKGFVSSKNLKRLREAIPTKPSN